MTTQDLITRLEKATGPDRALWDEVNDHAWKAHWIDTAWHLVNRTLIEQAFALPDGNLLIAVALTLVPEGWCLLMAWKPSQTVCDVHSRPLGDPSGVWPAHASAPTPAIALYIAALRARAALTTTEGR